MRYLDLIYTEGVLRAVSASARKIVQSIRSTLGRRRLRRDRRPDAALDRRRRGGAAVQDASQRARHAAVPADRAGAAPQAAAGRRHRAGVRAGPRLSQRRDQPAAQSRVHDARGLSGLRRLPLDDGPDREADRRDAIDATGQRLQAAVGRQDDRLHAAVCPRGRTTNCSPKHAGVEPPTMRRRSASWPRRSASRRPASIPTSSRAKSSKRRSKTRSSGRSS